MNLTPLAKLLVRVVKEDFPVIPGHRVLSRPDVVAQFAVDQLTRLRHLLGLQASCSQKPVHGIGGLQDLKLASGISPGVLHRIGKKHRTGGHEGYQAVLVKRQPIGPAVELLERAAKPVWEVIVNLLDRLADLAPAGSSAA